MGGPNQILSTGKNTLQGIGKSREADSGGVQDRVGGQRAAQWRLPALASNKENAGQSAAKIAHQSGGGGGDHSGSELMQSLQLVRESFLKEGDRVRGIEEKQEVLTKEFLGLKEEMQVSTE